VPFALPRSRALWVVLAALVSIAFPSRSSGQSVLGYGEDATAAPSGAIRLRLWNDWHRSSEGGFESDTWYFTDRQSRASNMQLEIGVLSRFSIGVTAPWVTTKSLTFVSSQHAIFQGVVLDTLLETSHNGWGNIEAFGKIVWLGEPGQQARLALRDGVHIRSALVGGALLGTGVQSDPTDPFGIGTSDRAKAVVARSATDVTVGKHFFGSIVARYEKPLADDYRVAVHPGDDPFASDAVAFLAQRKLGNSYEIELTPRYQLGRYFSAGVQYRYHHTAQASYTGTATATDTTGNPVTLDAASLDAGTDYTEQRLGFGVVYSAVDAYTRNRSRIPVEVTFEYSKAVKESGNRPKDSSAIFSVRIFRRLWGAEFAPPRQDKKQPSLEPGSSP
jgi:hypothetical protein